MGKSEWAVFFRVTLPLAWHGIMAGAMLGFARALGEFGATLMVAGNIPGRTQTLSIAIYDAVEAGRDSVANFLVVITSIVCITILVASGRLLKTPLRGLRSDPVRIEVSIRKVLRSRARQFNLDVAFTCQDDVSVMFGPSGSGKSVTLKAIAGLEHPDQGRVVVDGRVLFDSAAGIDLPARDRSIGYLFQDYALFPHMTGGGKTSASR